MTRMTMQEAEDTLPNRDAELTHIPDRVMKPALGRRVRRRRHCLRVAQTAWIRQPPVASTREGTPRLISSRRISGFFDLTTCVIRDRS
jgi:hypothetical protein